MLGLEASRFLKKLSEQLAYKWERSYSPTFSIFRLFILCLRGSRTKWQSNMIDGSPLSLMMSQTLKTLTILHYIYILLIELFPLVL